MQGFIWSIGLWGILVAVILPFIGHRQRRWTPPNREFIALIMLLIGTTSTVSRPAQEILDEPVIFENLIRGSFATIALWLTLPLVIQRINPESDTDNRALTAMTFYGLAAVASIAYSVAPFSTAGKAYELLVALVIVWAMALHPGRKRLVRDAVEWLVLLGALEVGVAVVGFFLAPDMFSEVQSRTSFIGTATMVSPFAHSNGLSAQGALVSAYAMARWLGTRYWFGVPVSSRIPTVWWQLIFAIGTLGTVLASARQGLVIWMVSIAIVLWVYRRTLLLVAVPVVAMFVIQYWDRIWQVVSRGQQQVTLATWSGRLTFWEVAIEAWSAHPWTGYGFGAGGRFVALAQIDKSEISSLHSGYFEALIGVGLIGLIPLGYAIWGVARWSSGQLMKKADVSAAVLLVPLLLHASVSLGFAGWVSNSVLLFLLLVALADVERSERVLRPPNSLLQDVSPPESSRRSRSSSGVARR